MEFHKFIHKTGVPKWRVPLNRARHAIYLIKNIPREKLTQSEKQLIRKAKESSIYWELLEEENQPNVVVGTPKTLTVSDLKPEPEPPELKEPDLIVGGMANE